MANERDEQKPRFQIIDNRLLSEDERKGNSSAAPETNTPLIQVPGGSQRSADAEAPKLEIIGGGSSAGVGSSSLKEEAGEAVSAPIAAGNAADASETTPAHDLEAEDLLSEDEVKQMQAEMEAEQFAALEEEVGRPLSDEEKEQVRKLMSQQAQTMSRLEVSPLLLQTISELPRYAAVHLGLLANPYTGLIARNDTEARLAIEAFSAIYDVIKGRTDSRINGELTRVLNDLKTNYTRITGSTIGPTGGPRIIR
jgi:hypothetical protein